MFSPDSALALTRIRVAALLLLAVSLAFSQAVAIPGVSIEDIGEYEGEETWKIRTPSATYFYHKTSGGFASLLDRDGNDWISYHPRDKERGEYRGIPNIAPPQFHPGRPEGKRPGRIVTHSEDHVRLLAETEDGRWATQWDIYPTFARMTLLRKGPEPYWILYEGTPGGEFSTSDYWVNSAGERFESAPYVQKNPWHGDLPSPEWVYFGDAALNRVLLFAREPYSPAIDEYWHFGDGGMTVFGFGRGPRAEGWQRLTDVPTTLTIGFVESTRHADVKAAWEATRTAAAAGLPVSPTIRPGLGEIHYSPLSGGAAAPQGRRLASEILAEGDRLRGIRVCTTPGDPVLIASVRFPIQRASGGEESVALPDSNGRSTSEGCADEFSVADGATLAGISGAGGWFVDQLRFHFTDGSVTPTCGGSGGDHEFAVMLRKRSGRFLGRISGFWGTLDGNVESLGLLYWPEE